MTIGHRRRQTLRPLLLGASAAVVVALVWSISPMRVEGQAASTTPHYEENGDLKLPEGYETWVFVGSNLGMGYKQGLEAMTRRETLRAERGEFHNIYINPEAYAYFTAKREFPDPTVLVMEHFRAADKEPKGIVDKGVFNGARSGLEVAVKNLNRPDGSSTPWAYYIFTDPNDPETPKTSAPAFRDADCYDCHLKHADIDNVWVQFYPVLRRFVP